MSRDKPRLEQPKPSTRERVLDAAERLLAQRSAAFSMRELADEAGLSFATPFNQFGSKAAIMQALSARRIAAMRERLAQATLPNNSAARVLKAVDIAAAVMLAAPGINRVVMGAISTPSDNPGSAWLNSRVLWGEALGAGEGLAPTTRTLALTVLPDQLAFAFRGVLSFWTAGELSDQMLGLCARAAAATILLGFIGHDRRAELLALLEK